MPESPQPSWRAPGSTPSGPTASRPWQPSDVVTGDGAVGRARHNIKLSLVFGTLVLLAIGIGAVVIWLRPIKPASLVLIGSGYEQNLLLPLNIHGWNGLTILDRELATDTTYRDAVRLPWDQPTKMRRVGRPVEARDQSWQEIWENLNLSSLEEKTLVLFLSLHGMAEKDEAYLLPNSQTKLSPNAFAEARIPFRAVLDSLKTVKNKHIVLLLDAAQVQSHWPTGMLHNEFVKRLQEKYETEIREMGNLVVICSTSPDQRSWSSDDLQNSVFCHYVGQGLQGAGQSVHERVTAWKLFKYVEEKVDRWVQTNRARRQTPLMIGNESLAREIEIVHIAENFVESDPPAARAPDTEKLTAAWTQWRKLKTEQTPIAHSPHLWRLYEANLLRYEQLLNAGDPTAAAEIIKRKLERLSSDIIATRTVDRSFASLGNSIPIAQFLGYRPGSDNLDGVELLAGLRRADNDAERGKVFDRYRGRSPRDKQYLLVRTADLVLKGGLNGTRSERLLEQDRLAEIERELRTPMRPVEAHLLKMIRDADPALDENLVRLALRARGMAEVAALGGVGAADSADLYAEAVHSFTKREIDQADLLRREGEDWLFGTPAVHAKNAQEKLSLALEKFEKARAVAARLQGALALRDVLSNELPYFGRWLAELPPGLKQANEEMVALRIAVESLGTALAGLNRDLDVLRKVPAPADLANIETDLKSLREAHHAAAERLRKSAVLQQNWHALDALLSIPPMDGDVSGRIPLLVRQRFISGELFRNIDLEGKAEDEEPVKNQIDRRRKLLRASLAPFDELRENPREAVDLPVRDFYMKAARQVLLDSTGIVGDESEPLLQNATGLCRAVPSFAADLMKTDTGNWVNPVDRLRRLRTFRLMHWLAERTWEDHYYEPATSRSDTYYIPAAKGYLDTARSLFSRDELSRAFVDADEAMQKKLTPSGLAITKDPNPYWTTEFDFPLAWQVQADQGTPPGAPMVWLEVKKKTPDDAPSIVQSRKAVSPWPTSKTPFAEPFSLNLRNLPKDGENIARLHTLYRGQHRIRDVQLRRTPPRVIVRNLPTPDKAGLAVRMDSGFDFGAVSIVIDNSGSMKYVHPEKGEKDKERLADRAKGEKRRFDFALEGLGHVLRKIPDNTLLSIYTLGRKIGTEYVTGPIEFRPPSPWRKEKELENLLANLTEAPGEIASPIADGIAKSMAEGFPENFQGPKVVVVLTDGDDNNSFGSTYNPKEPTEIADHTQTVIANLKRLAGQTPDVQVVVVCFIQKSNPEFARAEAQFKIVEQFELPGAFLVVPQGEQLGAAIEGLIRPRFELRLNGNVVDGFELGQPVNYPDDLALKWTDVRPNLFRARLPRSLNKEIGIDLPPGQNLFTLLKRQEKVFFLERGLLGLQREFKENKNIPLPVQRDGWLVSLVENHNNLSNRLSQTIVLEKTEIERDLIRQTNPGFVWLELTSRDGKRPDHTLTWGRDWSLPGAGLRLETPDWPLERPSKVAAWFWPQERDHLLLDEKLFTRVSIPIGSLSPVSPTRRISSDPVVESVLWEDRNVEMPGGRTIKEPCLVVRVRHQLGRPVFVMLDPDRSGVGAEHQYFPEAARSTASFYRLPKGEVVDLILLDVEAFKEAARRVEFMPDERFRTPGMFLNRLE